MTYLDLTLPTGQHSTVETYSQIGERAVALDRVPSRLLRACFLAALATRPHNAVDDLSSLPGPMVDSSFLFACERMMKLNAPEATDSGSMCARVASLYVLSPQHRASVYAPGIGTLTATFDAPLSARYRTFPVSKTRSHFTPSFNKGAFEVAYDENRPLLALKGEERALIGLLDRATLNQSRAPVAPFLHETDLYVVSQLTTTSRYHVAALWKIVPREEYDAAPRSVGAIKVETTRGLRRPGDRTGELLQLANRSFVLASYATAIIEISHR